MYYLNYLGSATETLGVKIANLAQIFPFSFMPPGRAFMASWGLIFISLLVFFILFITRKESKPIDISIYNRFWLSIIFNIARLLATGQRYFILSVVIIALLGYSIGRILYNLKTTAQQYTRGRFSRGIYYGRITIAACTIWVSQIMYSFYPEFALSTLRWYCALVLWFVIALASYWKLKNIYALIWSLFALGAATYTMIT